MVRTFIGVTALAAASVVMACRRSGTEPGGTFVPPPLPARSVFPADNPWNRDVSQDPVDAAPAPASARPSW